MRRPDIDDGSHGVNRPTRMGRREFVRLSAASAAALCVGSSARAQGGKKKTMLLKDLKVPPFQSTLMGVVRAVADFYDITVSDAMLYGCSGHAFMMNIHKELCPSGPYCWKREPFYALLANQGILMKDQGFYSAKSTTSERAMIENVLRNHLASGHPCGLVNMEFQLIPGHDETGFITSQPWKHDFPPRHLMFSTWSEFGKEIHVNFFTFSKTQRMAERDAVAESLTYALDLYQNPSRHTSEPYFTGAAAFDTWVKAVQDGHGGGHGNWWNASVWGECRKMASAYMGEIAQKYPTVADAAGTAAQEYAAVAETLLKVSDKKTPAADKVDLLNAARKRELLAVEKVGQVVAGL